MIFTYQLGQNKPNWPENWPYKRAFLTLRWVFSLTKCLIRSGPGKNWPYKRVVLTFVDHTSGRDCIISLTCQRDDVLLQMYYIVVWREALWEDPVHPVRTHFSAKLCFAWKPLGKSQCCLCDKCHVVISVLLGGCNPGSMSIRNSMRPDGPPCSKYD